MNNIVRGFCATKNQHDHLAEYGVEPKSIWLAGRSGETIDRCQVIAERVTATGNHKSCGKATEFLPLIVHPVRDFAST